MHWCQDAGLSTAVQAHNLLCYFYAGINNIQQKILGEALIIYNTTAKCAGADLPEPLLLEERNREKYKQ